MTSEIQSRYNIICFSNQLWEYPLWTNKKQVMSRLAQQGHKVLFVDPPINTGRLFFKQLFAGKWSLRRLIMGTYVEGGLTIYTPLKFIPFEKFLARLFARKINLLNNRIFDPNFKTVLWIYHVEIEGLEELLKNVKHDFLVYDCVDNYSAFPRYDTPAKKAKIDDQERMLASRANLVFATAPGLLDKLKKCNQNTFYTPNVGDYEKFKNALSLKDQIPQDLQDIPKPIIGYTGAIDEYKFDALLFKQLAQNYPKYSFVIIGPMALQDREASLAEIGLSGLPNVYFLGSRKYTEIPKYYAGFDAMIIPYQLNDYTVGGCFPVKFHDALAAGLPLVVTDLPAYSPFNEVCYISKTYNEFSQNLRRALEDNNSDRVAQRQLVAKENSWEGKVHKMLSYINQYLIIK